MNKLYVQGVAVSEDREHVLVLRSEKQKVLPVVINELDAHSISLSLDGIKLASPMMFDFVKNLCSLTGCKMTKVIIHDMVDGMLFSKIEVEYKDKKVFYELRFTDAILLAINNYLPIYLSSKLEKYLENDFLVEFDQPLLN